MGTPATTSAPPRATFHVSGSPRINAARMITNSACFPDKGCRAETSAPSVQSDG
ncbi:MAG: hypothetical protein U0797_19785 [Gemmataceae bacterium]